MSMSKDLNFWLSHIESFHSQEIELGLDRIKLVADKMQLLPLSSKIVLVGGTNGKGSCVALLEAISLLNKQKIATYTSPHLVSFNERIRINGVAIDDCSLIEAFNQIEKHRGDIPLTFFEFTTLAALSIFSQRDLQLIVLEVGLGGRQDATNIVEPDVCIISTVDLDHADWLGDSLEAIAYEKGGIIREQKPALVGDHKTLALLNQVLPEFEKECMLINPASDDLKQQIENPEINCFQLLEQNIMLAKSAYEYLFDDALSECQLSKQIISQALSSVQLRGRFQQLNMNLWPERKLTVIVDVAHNPQAAKNLAIQLNTYRQSNQIQSITAICGMMKDKAIDEVLISLANEIDSWCFVDLASPRAITADLLNLRYCNLGLTQPSQSFSSVADAMQALNEYFLVQKSTDNSLVLVFGSFITVANMLQYQADNL